MSAYELSLVRVERTREVIPGYYAPPPGPRIYERDVYVSETSLYDLRGHRLVWSGTVKTDAIGDIDKAIKQYVKTVVRALERDGVLAAA